MSGPVGAKSAENALRSLSPTRHDALGSEETMPVVSDDASVFIEHNMHTIDQDRGDCGPQCPCNVVIADPGVMFRIAKARRPLADKAQQPST